MDDFEREIKVDFLVEAKDLLSSVEQCFLDLERRSTDVEVLNNLFRLAHNLKGASGAVGFSDLAEFTHKLESLLLALKENRIAVTKSIVDLLLRSNDYLVKTLETLQSDLAADYGNPRLSEELCDALRNPSQEPVSSNPMEAQEPSLIADTQNFDRQEPVKNTMGNQNTVPESAAVVSMPHQPKAKEENIRVSLLRIEQLLNNVGELSILQAVMTQQSYERGTVISPLMRETLSAMSKIVKETQSISMGLRMLPVKQTFQKMQRIVRDTSKALGKNVELHLSGEETEIDKTVLEQLGDPLIHIIRNAVDHGLEGTDGRQSAGKSLEGHIHLSAFHRAGLVVIEIRDDGKGLDPEKLIEKAKAKGILAADTHLSDEQAYELIFAPGFSTKECVTDVSGRGVGMDVVRTNITALQGQVEIETSLGRGTCFRISLPLTLAIVDSVVIRLNTERYVIPLAQVNEFFRPQESEINFACGRSELLTVREETLATFRLSSLIGRDPLEKSDAWTKTALIVSDGRTSKFAVLVDQVISQQQVVIKPLGNEVKGKPGLMGSAILGDGKPALILDLFELTKSLRETDVNKMKIKANRKMEAA